MFFFTEIRKVQTPQCCPGNSVEMGYYEWIWCGSGPNGNGEENCYVDVRENWNLKKNIPTDLCTVPLWCGQMAKPQTLQRMCCPDRQYRVFKVVLWVWKVQWSGLSFELRIEGMGRNGNLILKSMEMWIQMSIVGNWSGNIDIRIRHSTDLREPRQTQALSPITHGSSSSLPSSLSPLASSLTRSLFHSDLALQQILSSIDLFLSYRTDSTDFGTI